jgi:tetratricopeptide (TPR) repeat protein
MHDPADHPDLPDDLDEPQVMFLPLAAAPDAAWNGTEPGVFARRIPDFLHQVLNRGQPGPTAMLELQSAADHGPVSWVQLDAPPERDEAFELLPPDVDARAVVSGELAPAENGLRIEFHVFRDEEGAEFVTEKVGGVIPLANPVPGLLRLLRHLAKLLDVPFHEPPKGLLTDNGAAFRLFLQGLDNAMLLSGDLDIAVPDDKEALIRPFADALELDPSFGLALRVANATAAIALHGSRLDHDAVRRFLDRCYEVAPADGEACVAIAEQLSDMGDDERALAWLQHATHLDPPPPRGLESLGIILARRGDPSGARGLWQKGLDVDGHPDFFSHLAQLSFAEGQDDDAWGFVLRGLRRLHERTVRAAEWEDDHRDGVLLECLHAQLGARKAPASIVAALLELRALLGGESRVFLGLCLFAIGDRRDARAEIVAGLRGPVEYTARDCAVRALLQIDVADFEARFARACERARRGRNPRPALAEFQLWLHLQPEFWPALYYSAIAKRRLRQSDEALDLLATALEVSPDQPDLLAEMAEVFAERQNPKRALELVEEALKRRHGDGNLLLARVRYLLALGRKEDAATALQFVVAVLGRTRAVRKLERQLRR